MLVVFSYMCIQKHSILLAQAYFKKIMMKLRIKKKLFSDMIYNNHSMVVDVFLIYDPVAPYIKK